MTGTDLAELAAHMRDRLDGAILEVLLDSGELTLVVDVRTIVEVMRFVRDDPLCRFTSLIDICGVDYPERERRFEVVYHVLSMPMNQRLRVRCEVGPGDSVNSIVEVYPAADWYEREAFDMYGIVFPGHPDLRRILTDYGFEGHPLRKDFPLSGHHQVRYDLAVQKVVREPVALAQSYRDFDFASPWRGSGKKT